MPKSLLDGDALPPGLLEELLNAARARGTGHPAGGSASAEWSVAPAADGAPSQELFPMMAMLLSQVLDLDETCGPEKG